MKSILNSGCTLGSKSGWDYEWMRACVRGRGRLSVGADLANLNGHNRFYLKNPIDAPGLIGGKILSSLSEL
jgi:hypothetical protein